MSSAMTLPALLLLLAVFATHTHGQDPLACAPGWMLHGKSCYKLFSEKMEWSDASDVCMSYGSQLVKIFGFQHNKEVSELVRSQGVTDFWIGELMGQKRGNEGFWSGSEPKQGRDCAYVRYETREFYRHVWSKARCNAAMPFMCEANAILAGMFSCLNGNFIKMSDVCDGHNGCGDDSDERDCPLRCRQYLKRLAGTIQTQNPYGLNENCQWVIESPVGSRVMLDFTSVRTEENKDEIQVWVGGPTLATSDLAARLSGTMNVNSLERIYSRNNFLIVVFTSDSSISMSGFVADYYTEDILPGIQQLLLAPELVPDYIESPMYGERVISSHRITYNIYVPLDRRVIYVQVVDVDLPADAYVEFYDGNSMESPILARLEGGDAMAPQSIVSTTNNMTVYYHTGSTNYAGAGVRLAYRQGCGGQIQADFGEVISPGYNAGLNYPNYLECNWTVVSDTNVALKFIIAPLFGLSGTLGDDVLEIYEGQDDTGSVLTQVTGDKQPSPSDFVVNSGRVYIYFKTTSINSGIGFKISFSKNCPDPDFPVNSIVTPTTVSTVLGTKLTISCPTGYFFAQEQHVEKQRVYMECLPGGWSVDSVPRCNPVYCGQPPSVNNAHILPSNGVQYEDVVTYECDPGFGFAGTNIVTCRATSDWTTPPVCIPASCIAQLAPAFGFMVVTEGSGTDYGSIVEFTCENGYQISGIPIITCRGDGSWSADKPTCIRLICPLPDIANAETILPAEVSFGSVASVTCAQGFEISGNPSMTCQADQTFNEVPECNDIVECAAGQSGSCQQTCTNTIGSFECTCDPGNKLADGSTTNCLDINECDVDNGGCSGTCINAPAGSYTCTCPAGFQLFTADGDEGFTTPALESGTRFGDVLYFDHTCVPEQCQDLADFPNGNILSQQAQFHYQDQVNFFCDLGYQITDANPMVCQSNGNWDRDQPSCNVATCPIPSVSGPFPPTFSPSSGVVNYGDSVTLTCTTHLPDPVVRTRECVYDQDTDTYTLDLDDSLECPVIDCGDVDLSIVPASVFKSQPSDTYYGSTFQIGCGVQSEVLDNTGNAEGPDVVVCRDDSNWDFGVFRCLAKQCSDPGTPPGATQLAESYSEGTSVKYECLQVGFTLTSSTPRICQLQGNNAVHSGTTPQCVDTTNPIIEQAESLCGQPVTITKLTSLVNHNTGFTLPTATDNTGGTEMSMSMTVNPMFNPSALLINDLRITYTATDFTNSNRDTCSIDIKMRDDVFPVVACPPSYSIELMSEDARTISFPEDGHAATATDNETPGPTITYTPSSFTVTTSNVGEVKSIDVEAIDASNNRRKCAFTVDIKVGACQAWALASPRGGIKTCSRNSQANGYNCVMTCNDRHYFYDDPNVSELTFSCIDGSPFSPSTKVPDCVPAEDSEYLTSTNIVYTYSDTLSSDPDTLKACNQYYLDFIETKMPLVGTFFSDLCAQFLETSDARVVPITDNDDYFYSLFNNGAKQYYVTLTFSLYPRDFSSDSLEYACGSLIPRNFFAGLAFTRGEMGTIPASSLGCPELTKMLNAAETNVNLNGRVCSDGYKKVDLPSGANICVPCPYGSKYSPGVEDTHSSFCTPCAMGEYSDVIPISTCSVCGVNTYTAATGSTSAADCLDTCINVDMKSASNGQLAPCQQCPQGQYALAGTSTITCEACPSGQDTSGPGAALISQCLDYCPAGQYSSSGLAACVECPLGFYQEETGRTSCKECASDQTTVETGADASALCQSGLTLVCNSQVCNGHGVCSVSQHLPLCTCDAGYTGSSCETVINYCESSPCYSGDCTPTIGSFTCECPSTASSTAYSGTRCEVDPDNCVDNLCKNGGMCQDRVDSYICLCPENYSGTFCQNSEDICNVKPCLNSGRCMEIGPTRRYCECLDGFTGRDCENNIDECASNPCLYGGVCVDGSNGFTCSCPFGFGGSRCEFRPSLCALSPCGASGDCIDDYLDNYYMCLCNQGYEADTTLATDNSLWMQLIDTLTVDNSCPRTDFCVDVDACERGTCSYSPQGATCTCPFGYDGTACQHDIDNCAGDPCGVNGRCVDKLNQYVCVCDDGYSGNDCQTEVNECRSPSYPCGAAGTDTSKGRVSGCDDLVNGYVCYCHPGYTGGADGDDCSVDIEECLSNPCLHEGACAEEVNGYRCDCVEGWTGARCELYADYCQPDNPCQNDATCLNVFASPVCQCSDRRYYGPLCELEASSCSEPDPCIDPAATCFENDNGEAECDCSVSGSFTGRGCHIAIDFCGQDGLCQHGGTCSPDLDGYTCHCTSDFYGSNCEQSLDNCLNVICPNGGQCVDGEAEHFCECPIGKTGPACGKDVDDDFDINFYSEDYTATACMLYPFQLGVDAFSIGFWLRFHERGGEGTVLTLFGSDERYAGSRMREILRVDHEKVYLTFGYITEAFLFSMYDINGGQWYYINIQWSGDVGSASVMVNSVKVIDVKSGHGEGWTMPDFGTVVLGADVDANMEPIEGSGFNGAVSKVNMWDRVLSFLTEIPLLADDSHSLVLPGLIRRWDDFLLKFGATVSRPSDANDIVCVNELFTGSACNVPVPDKTPPKILNCPETVWEYNPNRLTQVEWPEVVIEGADEPGSSIRSTYLNDQVFIWGKYTNCVVAKDSAGNAAMCAFDIYVRKFDCPAPVPAPLEGSNVCSPESWPFRNCEATCNADKAFSVPVPIFYTCGPQGSFNVHNPNLGFVYPACSATTPARVNVRVYITYEQISACEEVLTVSGFAIPILNYIRALNVLWGELTGEEDGFCHRMDCKDVVQVESECAGANTVGRRRKRSVADAFIVITLMDIKEYLYDSDGAQQTPAEILLAFILDDGGFDLSDSIANGFPNEPALRILMSPICGEGQTIAASGLDCVDCAPGTYYDADTEVCMLCPVGTYQDQSKATSCKTCGIRKTTEIVGTTNSADCYDVCDPGTYLNKDTGVCQWCEIGFYQELAGQFYCEPCSADKTTQGTNSNSITQCLDVCPDGTELTAAGSCTVCPRGTYRTQGVQARCTSCPGGFVTATTQSRTEDECIIPDCQAGSYHDVTSDVCQLCAIGLYQPLKWMEACVPCPDRKTTLLEGAQELASCLYFCLKGQEEYPVGASLCRLCPLGTYKDNANPGEQCTSCEEGGKPGFVTEASGSTALTNCTILGCLAGEQPNANEDDCDMCPLGTYQPSPYQPQCEMCPPGTSTREEGATVSSQCESYCEPGYFHDAFRTCIACAVGTYRNNNDGSFGACETCPVQFITQFEASTLPGDCSVQNCTAGYFLDVAANACRECFMGEYQDEWWQTECKTCPPLKTTEQTGSDSEDDCLLSCPVGSEDVNDECVVCSIGYYKSVQGSTLCVKCPEGYITAITGATSSGACTVGDCQPGSFLADDLQCYECDTGFYQGNKWQTDCLQCPVGANGLYLTTAGTGADEAADCFLLCDSGSEFSAALQRCTSCPRGTYRMVNVHDFCTLCPIDFITDQPSSVTLQQCIVANCSSGTYLDTENNVCLECPLGQYQTLMWQTQCTACPFGRTTLLIGGADISACVRSCPAGQELTETTNECRPCPQDKYRDLGESFTCLACPAGTIAPSQGASSAAQCTWADCPPGYFIRNDACEPCEDGTYQPDKWKTACLLCRGSPRVTTGGTGASAITDCQSTDDCMLNENLCQGVGEECYDTEGLNAYECRCQGKYIARNGLTAPCVHKCEQDVMYCLNNATCDRNQLASNLCKCVGGWRGERCDEEPASMTNYIIGGAVGGFIFLILLILIIVFCCVCLRPTAPVAAPRANTAQSMMMLPPQGMMMAKPAPSVLYQTTPTMQPGTIISGDQQSLAGYSTMGGQQYMFYEDQPDTMPQPQPQQQQYGTLNGGFDPYEEKVSAINFA